MQFVILIMIILSLFVSMAPLAHPENPEKADEVIQSQSSAPNVPSGIGSAMRSGTTSFMEEIEIENPITTVKKSAEDAARSIGRNLGHYIRGKYKQMKNAELVERFNLTVQQSIVGLPLTAAERQKLTLEVEQAYIQDAELGKNELDQHNFSDLAYVIRKEYSELLRERTLHGTVDTYDFRGHIKTRWNLKNGQPDGSVVTYYEDGEIKFIDVYENGRRLNRKKFDPEGRLIFEQNYSYEANPPVEPKSEIDSSASGLLAMTSPSAPSLRGSIATEAISGASAKINSETMDDSTAVPVHYRGSQPVQKNQPL